MTWTEAATACTIHTAATGLHWTVQGSDATGWYIKCVGAYAGAGPAAILEEAA